MSRKSSAIDARKCSLHSNLASSAKLNLESTFAMYAICTTTSHSSKYSTVKNVESVKSEAAKTFFTVISAELALAKNSGTIMTTSESISALAARSR